MSKEKVQNSKGEIVEVEVISEEESQILLESSPKVRITLQDALAMGHVPLKDFIRDLTNANNQ